MPNLYLYDSERQAAIQALAPQAAGEHRPDACQDRQMTTPRLVQKIFHQA